MNVHRTAQHAGWQLQRFPAIVQTPHGPRVARELAPGARNVFELVIFGLTGLTGAIPAWGLNQTPCGYLSFGCSEGPVRRLFSQQLSYSAQLMDSGGGAEKGITVATSAGNRLLHACAPPGVPRTCRLVAIVLFYGGDLTWAIRMRRLFRRETFWSARRTTYALITSPQRYGWGPRNTVQVQADCAPSSATASWTFVQALRKGWRHKRPSGSGTFCSDKGNNFSA